MGDGRKDARFVTPMSYSTEGRRAMPSTARIEVWKGKDGWYWRLKSKNGEILSRSEAYTRKYDAKRAAKRVSPTSPIVQVSA